MSDDPIQKQSNQDITSDTDNDINTKNTSPIDNNQSRVFDITPDLNIAPAKDETETPQPVKIPDNILPNNSNNDSITKIEIEKSDNALQGENKITETPTKATSIKDWTDEKYFSNPTIKTPVFTEGIPKDITDNKNLQNTNPVIPPNIPQNIPNTSSPLQTKETIETADNSDKTKSEKPKAPEKPWETKSSSGIKPLRTYETDIAEAMAKKRLSTASIVIAEDKKKQEEKIATKDNTGPNYIENDPNTIITGDENRLRYTTVGNNEKTNYSYVKPKSNKGWLLGLLGLILICSGVFIAYYLYSQSPIFPQKNPTITNDTVVFPQSIFPAEDRAIISIDNKNKNSILSAIKNEIEKPQTEKNIREIILTKEIDGKQVKVTANEILEKMNIEMPDLIRRSVDTDWMLGVYDGQFGMKHPFIIVTNNFFQNTFAGLIQWERTMARDLRDYLYPNSSEDSEFTLRGVFKDKIIRNRDVREYVSDNDYTIFLYSFISNDKLIITNNAQALEEIIIRLEKNAFIR